MELYLKNGCLITRSDWEQSLKVIEDQVKPSQEPLAKQKEQWIEAFEQAVIERAKDYKKVGLFFSGGVDSSLIALVLKKYHIPFTCYTIGFRDGATKEPEDIVVAKVVAKQYDLQHKYQILTEEQLKPMIKQAAVMLGEGANPVSTGVASVIIAATELAKQDNVTVLFGGLGAEEIFAGYHRHSKALQQNKLAHESWRGLYAMYDRDLVRDSKTGAFLNITVLTPFLEPDIIRIAMSMPEEEKIKAIRKHVLREIAEAYGLQHEFAFRPKRAAQYGSRIQKAIARLAKQQGMTEDNYVLSLRNAY